MNVIVNAGAFSKLFFGVISVLILMALTFLGWLKWVLSALFVLGRVVFGYIGIKTLVGSKEKSTQSFQMR